MLALGTLGPLASSALLSGGTSPVAAAQAIGGFTWLSWFVALAPVYYLLLLAGGGLIWLLARPEALLAPVEEPPEHHTRLLTPAELRVGVVSLGTALLWMLDQLTGWPPAVPALLALVALLVPGLGVMSWQELTRRAPWSTLFVLAAAVSLAEALTRSGAAAWLAEGLFGWLPATESEAAVALAVFFVAAVITLAIPNRAAAITLLVPLAFSFAAGGPASAVAVGLIVMIAVDVETIYPAQTAANLLPYERGYFGAALLARFNIMMLLVAAAVIVLIALPWWAMVGLPRV
jgi:sodium-dependent dicarboxylate transporter 2/3/5